MYRAWINQPSTLQRWHVYHAKNVLVEDTGKLHSRAVKIYFLEGSIISMHVERNILSKGWK